MKPIVVYTQVGCGPCQAEKAWLAQQGIPFEERDIHQNPEWIQELVRLGSTGTPTTVIGEGADRTVILGFHPQRLAQALELL
ncbi:MAG: glutaredoxin family protein [Firmicutes bacterium]|nr:glutaredoxin family protein [Alicyclobacillaceae bacterium]MCL6496898.1 glutaredoxin family protein [Bacillota bacterium]